MRKRFTFGVGLVFFLCSLASLSEPHLHKTKGSDTSRSVSGSLSSEIDESLRKLWASKNVKPAQRLPSEKWFRKATLDLLGRNPSVEEIEAYLKLPEVDRQRVACERLVNSEEWRDYTAHQLEILLAGQAGERTESAFRNELASRHLRHESYRLKRPGELKKAIPDWERAGGPPLSDLPHKQYLFPDTELNIRDAVLKIAKSGSVRHRVFYPHRGDEISYTSKTGESAYHSRELLVDHVSKAMLGMSISCVQCHSNIARPGRRPEMSDYWGMLAALRSTDADDLYLNWPDRSLSVSYRDSFTGKNAVAVPSYFGKAFDIENKKKHPIESLFTEIVEDKRFALNLANRLWDQMFGSALNFPHSVDDLELDEVLDPALLNRLADALRFSNYNPRGLLEAMCKSRAYALGKSDVQNHEEFYFQHGIPKTLTQTQILNTMWDVLGLHGTPAQPVKEGMAEPSLLGRLDIALFESRHSPDKPSGRHHPDSHAGVRSVSTGLSMLNAPVVTEVSEKVAEKLLTRNTSPATALDAAFLAFTGERPTKEDAERLLPMLGNKETVDRRAYTDLVWALFNSSRFHVYSE